MGGPLHCQLMALIKFSTASHILEEARASIRALDELSCLDRDFPEVDWESLDPHFLIHHVGPAS
jgi:hypothetical protein